MFRSKAALPAGVNDGSGPYFSPVSRFRSGLRPCVMSFWNSLAPPFTLLKVWNGVVRIHLPERSGGLAGRAAPEPWAEAGAWANAGTADTQSTAMQVASRMTLLAGASRRDLFRLFGVQGDELAVDEN